MSASRLRPTTTPILAIVAIALCTATALICAAAALPPCQDDVRRS